MPDRATASWWGALTASRARENALGGAHLVGTQNDLVQFAVFAHEVDVIGEHPQHTARGNERFDQGFKIIVGGRPDGSPPVGSPPSSRQLNNVLR
ncbi:MAG: hypothetical protein NZ553_01985, partial [Caldilinea sp.]|nr:hypothetical protein [Caldilinea sp.]MDW8439221.1 hypothetical protein [Caldilineaceae bacterium]